MKNPINKHFNPYYEIPYYEKNDFIFEYKGNLTKNEITLKTQKLRPYPSHLKATLFINSSKNLEFSSILLQFENLKETGNKFYKKQNFKSAIESYINVLLYNPRHIQN